MSAAARAITACRLLCGPLCGLLLALPVSHAVAQAPVERDAATQAPKQDAANATGTAAVPADARIVFPTSVPQGSLVIGRVPPAARVVYGGRTLAPTAYGSVVFGVGRDATGAARLEVTLASGRVRTIDVAITPRDWPLEQIRGVPPKTVNPPPEIAARIAREQAAVGAARTRDDDRADFAQPFAWPVRGRISGRFGNARVYTATDGSVEAGAGHSGMDIAVPAGTPVRAPAAGVITFAAPDLYLTGGTVVLDHGHGVSSNFLHLSRIDVRVGDRVAQGQIIAAVGATGRATGPHLHWGMNWFDVRVDPLLVLDKAGNGESGVDNR